MFSETKIETWKLHSVKQFLLELLYILEEWVFGELNLQTINWDYWRGVFVSHKTVNQIFVVAKHLGQLLTDKMICGSKKLCAKNNKYVILLGSQKHLIVTHHSLSWFDHCKFSLPAIIQCVKFSFCWLLFPHDCQINVLKNLTWSLINKIWSWSLKYLHKVNYSLIL